MNVKSRVDRLEREGFAEGGRVRFRVVVPPKMTREEWDERARELRESRAAFTVDFNRGRGE